MRWMRCRSLLLPLLSPLPSSCLLTLTHLLVLLQRCLPLGLNAVDELQVLLHLLHTPPSGLRLTRLLRLQPARGRRLSQVVTLRGVTLSMWSTGKEG